MDNEKYGIELELITNKFKQKMQEIKGSFSSLTDKKINLTANTAQIENLKYQIEQVSAKLRALKSIPVTSSKFNYEEILKAEAQLERLTNQYNKLIGKQYELNKASNISTKNMMKGFDKVTSKIKRFGLSLLSIRSIWALVSRASSAYLAQDTELANKLQSAWVGLGAILAPIINFISTLILKLVSVINTFIKALTGVDLIAKATAKSMKNAAGGANALKKSLAGFDELNNLDSDIGGAGGLAGGWADAFANIDSEFESSMAKLEANLDASYAKLREKMVGSIKDMETTMKRAGLSDTFVSIYDWGAMGAVRALDGFVDSLQGILELVDGILTGDKEKVLQGFLDITLGIKNMLSGVLTTLVSFVGLVITGVLDLWDWISKKNDEMFKGLFNKIDSLPGPIRYILNTILGFVEGTVNIVKDTFDGLSRGIRGILEGFLKFFKGDFEGGFKSIAYGLANAFIGILNAVISAINAVVSPIRALIVEAGKISGKNWTMSNIKIPKIPYLEVGTNYVPQDQIAMIHKGEAVIPKKFNSKEYFSGANDETNAKLDDLIEAVRNIEINPYTTIREVGKASLSYINSKSRQLGESVVY